MKYMTMRALFKTKTVYFLHGIRKFFFILHFVLLTVFIIVWQLYKTGKYIKTYISNNITIGVPPKEKMLEESG